MKCDIPKTQAAVQLVGPDQLSFNGSKSIPLPGPYQILCKVEAASLCFSDLKLLKQFSEHARKSEILSGIDPGILSEIPSYVPGEAATVPGHEAVVRVWAVGEKVAGIQPGGRYLVQTDYRWLPTENSNASFGYNFEGALQEYVLMDQRIITSPEGESMLIAASEELAASAVALVEPWACVENAYVSRQRKGIKADGHMLVVADAKVEIRLFEDFLHRFGKPAEITWVSRRAAPALDVPMGHVENPLAISGKTFDDVVYFGCNGDTVEALFAQVGTGGLLNIVLSGGKFGRDITTYVGRVHYGGIRIIGTTGSDPGEAMAHIPSDGEIRKGDKVNVVGAGGPMGVMHVIRNLCQGIEDVSVYAGDIDPDRLDKLSSIAGPIAKKNNLNYCPYSPKDNLRETFDYIALMAPIPALVAEAVRTAGVNGIINVFAGIPATVTGEMDLDAYIEKQLYFIGTSGSVLADMKAVLKKVESGQLDTNVSMAAVCSLEHAAAGIRAVEKQLIPGKIVVYPSCGEMELLTLEELAARLPELGACLGGGTWNVAAEKQLLLMKAKDKATNE